MVGCKYKNLATINEQIAIFQNMGFNVSPLEDTPLKITNDIIININSTSDINKVLTENNLLCTVQEGLALYKINSDAKIECLLFIYKFNNTESADTFYNYFYNTLGTLIYKHNQTVIQKSVDIQICNSAINTYYFEKFCTSIK